MRTLLILLLASLLVAKTVTTTFKEVNFNGTVVRNIVMVTDDQRYTIDLWYRQTLLLDNYMIVSCKAKEGYCLVERKSDYGWLERNRE